MRKLFGILTVMTLLSSMSAFAIGTASGGGELGAKHLGGEICNAMGKDGESLVTRPNVLDTNEGNIGTGVVQDGDPIS